eukprot:SAG31_NODE_1527_length_8004_cov_2.107147_4_plen_591_part_00
MAPASKYQDNYTPVKRRVIAVWDLFPIIPSSSDPLLSTTDLNEDGTPASQRSLRRMLSTDSERLSPSTKEASFVLGDSLSINRIARTYDLAPFSPRTEIHVIGETTKPFSQDDLKDLVASQLKGEVPKVALIAAAEKLTAGDPSAQAECMSDFEKAKKVAEAGACAVIFLEKASSASTDSDLLSIPAVYLKHDEEGFVIADKVELKKLGTAAEVNTAGLAVEFQLGLCTPRGTLAFGNVGSQDAPKDSLIVVSGSSADDVTTVDTVVMLDPAKTLEHNKHKLYPFHAPGQLGTDEFPHLTFKKAPFGAMECKERNVAIQSSYLKLSVVTSLAEPEPEPVVENMSKKEKKEKKDKKSKKTDAEDTDSFWDQSSKLSLTEAEDMKDRAAVIAFSNRPAWIPMKALISASDGTPITDESCSNDRKVVIGKIDLDMKKIQPSDADAEMLGDCWERLFWQGRKGTIIQVSEVTCKTCPKLLIPNDNWFHLPAALIRAEKDMAVSTDDQDSARTGPQDICRNCFQKLDSADSKYKEIKSYDDLRDSLSLKMTAETPHCQFRRVFVELEPISVADVALEAQNNGVPFISDSVAQYVC